MQKVFFRVLWAGALLSVLGGCTAMTPRHLGIRPDDPSFMDVKERMNVCQEFKQYAQYTLELKEAYHSRASQNRFWIYASGTTALGTAGATAGVAAVGAASSGTLALLPIAGAFVSSVFAMVDNPELAKIYTIVAASLETALQESESMLKVNTITGDRFADYESCERAYKYLREAVANAKNTLEDSRTSRATQALTIAKDEALKFNKAMDENKKLKIAKAVKDGKIVDIKPNTIKPTTDEKKAEIALFISTADLSLVGTNQLEVKMGDKKFSISNIGRSSDKDAWVVKFMAPGKPPKSEKSYSPILTVDGDYDIPCNTDVKLTYE